MITLGQHLLDYNKRLMILSRRDKQHNNVNSQLQTNLDYCCSISTDDNGYVPPPIHINAAVLVKLFASRLRGSPDEAMSKGRDSW